VTLSRAIAGPMSFRASGPLGVRASAGYTFVNAEAQALVARFSTPPTELRKSKIDTLIGALKTAGVWAKLDVLYVRAAADSQAARLNWVAAQYDATAVSSPAFLADRGYTPDGVASYLDSGFNPTTAVSPKFLLNDAHMGAWHLTDLANAGGISFDLGSTNSRITNNGSAATSLRVNGTAAIGVITEDYAKHKCWTRDGAASWRYYRDGALIGADPRVDASLALTNFAFCTGRTAASAAFGLNQEAISHWGGHLTTAQILAARNAFAAYLTAVGAV